MKKFPARLRILRNSFSQKEFANKLNIPQTTYSRYESGKNEPEYELLAEICGKFGVTADWLLGLTDDPSPHTGAVVQSVGAGSVAIGGANNGKVSANAQKTDAGLAPPRTEQASPAPSPCPDCQRKDETIARLSETVRSLSRTLERIGEK